MLVAWCQEVAASYAVAHAQEQGILPSSQRREAALTAPHREPFQFIPRFQEFQWKF